MPEGKPPFTVCINLDPESLQCRIWGSGAYPKVCREFIPCEENCGCDAAEAVRILTRLERLTDPSLTIDARGADRDDPSPIRE